MFYEERNLSKGLRFGDVVSGFPITVPSVQVPLSGGQFPDISVSVQSPRYEVVLSPCCSIGHSTLLLSPLIQIWRKWLGNPYLAEDLTRVNREMTPQQALSPEDWDKMGAEEMADRLEFGGPAFAFVELFVYEHHRLLVPYTLNWRSEAREVGQYMIDLRKIHRVDCPAVKSSEQCPLEAKVLELSIEARSQLRNKIADYFGRIPKEDEV